MSSLWVLWVNCYENIKKARMRVLSPGKGLTGRWALHGCPGEGLPICKQGGWSRWTQGKPRKSKIGDFTKVKESAPSLQGSYKKCSPYKVRFVLSWSEFDWFHDSMWPNDQPLFLAPKQSHQPYPGSEMEGTGKCHWCSGNGLVWT